MASSCRSLGKSQPDPSREAFVYILHMGNFEDLIRFPCILECLFFPFVCFLECVRGEGCGSASGQFYLPKRVQYKFFTLAFFASRGPRENLHSRLNNLSCSKGCEYEMGLGDFLFSNIRVKNSHVCITLDSQKKTEMHMYNAFIF